MANNVLVPDIPPFNSNDHFNENETLTYLVPSDLIPPNTRKLTIQWGQEIFKYEHIFLDSINSNAYENMEEVHHWLAKAREIQEELKNLGYNESVKHICELLRQKGQRLPNSNSFATNLYDVFQLFGNLEWYKGNVNESRTIIFKCCWGIFRSRHNRWIRVHVDNWLDSNRLKVFEPQSGSRRTGKNFVYSNFCKKISNTLSDNIIRTMTVTYGEYLCTRKKLPDTSLYEELHGMGGKCYLVLANSESICNEKELERQIDVLVDKMCKYRDPNYAYNLVTKCFRKKAHLAVENIDISKKGK